MQIIKRAALSLLGVVVMLAYWSFTGSSNNSDVKGIPAKVGNGGGGTLAIQVDSTSAARFSISFDENDKTKEYWTTMPPGSQTWALEIPKKSGGYIELNAENPKAGDKLSWKIILNGETVDTQEETLDKPLTAGYAFFLQIFAEDYSTLDAEKSGEEDGEED